MRRNLLAAALLVATGLGLSACATPVAAPDRRVEVFNDSGVTVLEFYASNVNRSTWEEDLLGRNVLPPGRGVMINIDDGSGACRFDFRAVLDDGRRVEQRNLNVCQMSRYVIR